MAALVRPIAGTNAERIAAELIDTFGGLRQSLAADPTLVGVDDPRRAVLDHLHLIEQVMLQVHREALQRPLLSSAPAVSRYLQIAMGHLRVEQVRVLYLDASLGLIRDEVQAIGDCGKVSLPIREILRRAVRLEATNLILAHNHPSGLAAPSRADIESTRAMVSIARTLGVELLDHLIVTAHSSLSLKKAGLL